MEKTEFALESFKNIQELIKFVEQKSGAVLIIAGLVFTGYFEFLKKLEFTKEINFYGVIVFLSSLATIICLLSVIYISIFKVLKPRLAKHYRENEVSLMYYEHLSCMEREEIQNKYKNLTEEIILNDIITQQHEISKILSEKTTELGKSFNFTFISIFSLIIFIISTLQL